MDLSADRCTNHDGSCQFSLFSPLDAFHNRVNGINFEYCNLARELDASGGLEHIHIFIY